MFGKLKSPAIQMVELELFCQGTHKDWSVQGYLFWGTIDCTDNYSFSGSCSRAAINSFPLLSSKVRCDDVSL